MLTGRFGQTACLSYVRTTSRFPGSELWGQTTCLIAEPARRTGRSQIANDYFNHAIRKGQQLVHELRTNPNRVNYVRKLLEMAFEQRKRNRGEQPGRA